MPNPLQQLLQRQQQLNMAPSPYRSLLVQQLLQQAAQTRGSNSPIESINIASKPILAALLARREQEAQQRQQQTTSAQQQRLMAMLQTLNNPTSDPAARQAALQAANVYASNLPQDNGLAQYAMQQLTAPREQKEQWLNLTPEEERAAGIPEPSFAQRNSVTGQIQIDDPPAALVDLNIDTESDAFKDLPTALQEAVIQGMERADTSRRQGQEMRIMRDMASGADTGLLTPVTLPIKQAFQSVGITLDDDVPLLESMRAQQNQLALRMRNPDSGFGLTGSTSDRDLRFLKESVPGLANTPQGNTAIALIMEAKMRRDADLEELRANYIQDHRGYSGWTQARQEWVDAHPFFTPEEQTFILSLSSPGAQLEGFGDMSPEDQRELIERERRNQESQIQ